MKNILVKFRDYIPRNTEYIKYRTGELWLYLTDPDIETILDADTGELLKYKGQIIS